ncbi:MAG TPA: hypothetical protein VLE91_01660, partial [Candidatus Saccharimonadales bacterium]|nr:hypothetical protein [Candidatus Saccharimonadales bacterium]
MPAAVEVVEILKRPNLVQYEQWPNPNERYEGDIHVLNMGAVTPLGFDLKSSWQKQIEGFSGLENSDLPEHGTEVKVFGKVKANHLELLEKIKG